MKKMFSDSIKADIKRVIKVILHEVELREIGAINGVVPVQILSKKFINAEDVVKIIKKINEGEKHKVLRIFSEHEFNKAFSSNKITGEGITKLLNTRSTLDLCFRFEKEHTEEYLYFLIENIHKLKEIKNDLDGSSEKITEKWFNYKNNSISFYGDAYKPRNEPQAKFIRQLIMRCQRENNNGTVLKDGQRVSEKNLSSEINLTIEQLRHIKKQLKRSFEDKGFPLKIDANAEGILLIYTI